MWIPSLRVGHLRHSAVPRCSCAVHSDAESWCVASPKARESSPLHSGVILGSNAPAATREQT